MTTKDEDIIKEARERFKRAQDRESPSRVLFVDDVRFGNADSDNGGQWPAAVRTARELEQRPCLTINKVRQHCLQIINDARQNKPSVQIRPVGDGATFDAAQVYEGVVRHIEYVSNAQQAYDTATWNQVFGGIGYWRVVTDYANNTSFDQEIYIRRVADPLSVFLDPDIQEYDGSDARWAVVFEDMSRDEAKSRGYCQDDDDANGPAMFDIESQGWNDKDHVRVAEYFRVGEKTDELILLPDEVALALKVPQGTTLRKSTLPPDVLALIPKDAQRRKVAEPEVEWFKIVGNEIVERKPWPGKYIPIVRVVGEETVIDGVLDRKGHVRALKDPQRMYNYNSSASVEYGALQSKTPFIAAAQATEGFETYWNTANTTNHSVLYWNAFDDEGRPMPKPERQQPPAAAPVFIEGMKVAEQELMLASGQYQAIMGAPSNETSGKAINARQRQGDNATYHYIDHQASAIRFTGKILIDLIPKIYDTPRMIQIIGRDGSRKSVQLDPKAPQGHEAKQDEESNDFDPEQVAAIFNPTVGTYDVMSDIGPNYATARQEAFNAFSDVMKMSPAMAAAVADLWAESGDFPLADKMAERLRRMVPQQALGGPSKEMQDMQAHMQQAAQAGQQQIEQLHAALQSAKAELDDKKAKNQLEEYRAETDRLKAVGGIDPEAMRPVIRQLVSEVLGTAIVPVMHQHALAEQAMQPPPPPVAGPTPPQQEPAPNGP